MRVRNKRVLKNGVLAGYVLQKDGTWKFRFLKGKRKKQRGGNALDWHLTPKQKEEISTNLRKLSNLKGHTLLNGKKREELLKDMEFLQKINIFAVLNFIASNNDLRVFIRKILKKGLTGLNTTVGTKIKNGLIVTIEEKMDDPHLIMASYFFIKGFGEDVDIDYGNIGKQIIDLIVSKKSYISRENTEDFIKNRNKNKKIGGPAPIFTNVRNVKNNLQTQPSRNENTAIRQIQRLYMGKKGRNTARNLKRKNTATRQIQRLYRGKKGRNTARNLKEKNTANTIRNEPKNNRRIINSNLNKKKKELKNIREQIKELTKYNNSRLVQRGLFNNNYNSGLFNSNVLAEHAKNIRSKKINQKSLLRKIQANSNKNKYKEFIDGINELDVSIRVLNNLIKEENKLRKNIRNLENKNKAISNASSMFTQANKNYEKKQLARNEQRTRKKKNNKEALKYQIEENLKILIKLLKEKGKRGTFNSDFGSKGYKYFAQELEKYKNYLNSNKKNNKLTNLFKILGEIKLRVEKPKNPKKNGQLRNSIKNLENKIQRNITIYKRNFS